MSALLAISQRGTSPRATAYRPSFPRKRESIFSKSYRFCRVKIAGDKPLVLPAAFSARKATLADPLQHGCAHFLRAHCVLTGRAARQVRGAVSCRQHSFHGIFDCRRFLLQT